VGPVLDGIASRRTAEYLATQITHPRDHNPGSLMPAFPLDPQKTGELVSYLESIPPGETAATKWNPLDYLGFTWIPAIRLNESNGTTGVDYDTRTMIVFLAGTLGDHLSMFVESNPADPEPGFANKWQTAQGLLNFGGSENFLQLRFGQLLTLEGNGFAGTDRFFSDSIPLIYLPVNGFTAARLGRGGSAEYTLGMATTLKAYAVEEADGSRAFGGVFERVIGKQGLSGISVEYAGGWNPNLGSGGREFHFQRWYFSGAKTFQNHSGRQVFDLIGGASLNDDNQLLGSTSGRRNTGYGSFVEADAFPVLHYLTTYARFDQLRATTQTGSSIKAGTAGIIIDATRYTRFLFEYQRFAAATRANFFTIGFRVNL
jgi:hypothetical protein